MRQTNTAATVSAEPVGNFLGGRVAFRVHVERKIKRFVSSQALVFGLDPLPLLATAATAEWDAERGPAIVEAGHRVDFALGYCGFPSLGINR
jgi:hypothetical protein